MLSGYGTYQGDAADSQQVTYSVDETGHEEVTRDQLALRDEWTYEDDTTSAWDWRQSLLTRDGFTENIQTVQPSYVTTPDPSGNAVVTQTFDSFSRVRTDFDIDDRVTYEDGEVDRYYSDFRTYTLMHDANVSDADGSGRAWGDRIGYEGYIYDTSPGDTTDDGPTQTFERNFTETKNRNVNRTDTNGHANNSVFNETIDFDTAYTVSPVAGDQSGDETELYTFDRYSLTSDYTSTRDWHDADAGLLHEDAFGSVSETVDANGQIASTWEDDVTVTDSGGNWVAGTNPTETELYNPDHAGRAFGYNDATSYLTGLGTTVALSGLVNQVANAEGEGGDTSDADDPSTPSEPITTQQYLDAQPQLMDVPGRAEWIVCACTDHSLDIPGEDRDTYEDSGGNTQTTDAVPRTTGVPCGPEGRSGPGFIFVFQPTESAPRTPDEVLEGKRADLIRRMREAEAAGNEALAARLITST